MNHLKFALYACYLAVFGSLIYVAYQGTEGGKIGQPCLEAIQKIGNVAGDPIALHQAEQDQDQKCRAMMKYDLAVGHMFSGTN